MVLMVLKDGQSVLLRPITPDDDDALRAFHDSLSDRTVYRRFFTRKRSLSDAEVDYFTHVDQHDRAAIVAVARQAGIASLTADVLPGNAAMLATFRASGFEVKQRRDRDVIVASFDIGLKP